MANVGYARVSTRDQNPQMQMDALEKIGCERMFVDKASGTLTERPQLSAALEYLRAGDVLCVWRLDRLGRSLKHLVQVIDDLKERGVGFRSVHENIDTTTANGRLTLHVWAALAEFEADLTRERTKAGLEAARARGRVGGRKPSLSPVQVKLARRMYEERETTVADIAKALGCSRATIYRSLSCGSTAEGSETGVPALAG